MQPANPSPAANRHGKLFKGSIIAAIVLLLGLSVVALVLVQKEAKDSEQQSQRLEKRIAALEAEDTFTESQIAKDRYQAVFLTNEQVYFGKITKVTKDTMKIEDIFYLSEGSMAGSGADSGSFSLAKLGDEVHGPEDAMILERKNITFWENLQSDGQVAKAIAEYRQAY